MEPRALQIIECDSNNIITVNEEVLRSVLTRDEISDKYVSIISIAGTFRQGKSFLLNFFLRYLKATYIQQRDVKEWLQPEDGPVEGFSWAPGSKRHTTGIVMWSEVFITKIPTGEEVAVILMDTQGSFDHQSSVDDCAKIFALSTLISSVQIYNVMRGIKLYDLNHLQCFAGLGTLFSNCEATPFQNLCFLVRDWACAYEHDYGEMGGSTLLDEVFDTDTNGEQVNNIKSLFGKVSCFLLPHPGRVVDTSKTFVGDLNDIDDDFKKHVEDLIPMFLAPENLILKSVSGTRVKAEELLCYIQEYSKVLKEGALPEVQTIFKSTVMAHYQTVTLKALKLYEKNMDADIKYNPKILSEKELYARNMSCKQKSVVYFDKCKKFDDLEIFDKYLVHLKNKMDEKFKFYRELNMENKRKHEERQAIAERVRRQTREPEAGGSGLGQLSTADTVGVAAAAIGVGAAVLFGVSKFFSNRGNND